MVRSWPSEPLATPQPPLSGPTRFSAGTRTSVKNTSLKSRSSTPQMDGNGRRTTPGRSVGITSTLMPLCLGASGSVRTNVSRKSASWAPEVHTFCPLTTKWSPSSTARVRSDARSEPALGSLMPSDAVFSPLSTGTAHRLLLLVGAERDQRCRNDVDALRVEAVVDAALAELLEMDELLQDGGIAAAELRRLARQQPAVVEQQPLPAARPGGHVRHRPGPFGGLGLAGQVGLDELHELGAELLDVGIEGELHV